MEAKTVLQEATASNSGKIIYHPDKAMKITRAFDAESATEREESFQISTTAMDGQHTCQNPIIAKAREVSFEALDGHLAPCWIGFSSHTMSFLILVSRMPSPHVGIFLSTFSVTAESLLVVVE